MDGGLWHCTGDKITPKKKKCKKAKWLSEETLQIAVKREVKNKGEKERYTHLSADFQRIARRDKKVFFSDQCKEIEIRKSFSAINAKKYWKTIECGKLEISPKELEIPREHFMQKWA